MLAYYKYFSLPVFDHKVRIKLLPIYHSYLRSKKSDRTHVRPKPHPNVLHNRFLSPPNLLSSFPFKRDVAQPRPALHSCLRMPEREKLSWSSSCSCFSLEHGAVLAHARHTCVLFTNPRVSKPRVSILCPFYHLGRISSLTAGEVGNFDPETQANKRHSSISQIHRCANFGALLILGL